MKLMKSLRNVAIAVMLFSAGVANATVYQFEITGDYTASWELDSAAIPDISGAGEGFIVWDVAGSFPGSIFDIADLTFYHADLGGGMEILDFYGDTLLLITDGPQLYTGTESSPFFTLGTFSLSEFMGTGAYTLTVTQADGAGVPEPATGVLLLGGLGLMVSLRKRQHRQA